MLGLDLDNYFFEKRVIWLDTRVDDYSASRIVKQLLYLDDKSSEDIIMIINSGGGSVTAGLFIYDTMQSINSDVSTIVSGMAFSMAAFLATCGTYGKRFATPSSSFMFHQPHDGSPRERQTVDEILTEAEHARQTKELMIDILSKHMNQPYSFVNKLFAKDTFLCPNKAVDIGAIDEVIYEKIY